MGNNCLWEKFRSHWRRYCSLSIQFQISCSLLLLVLIYFLAQECVLRAAGIPLLMFGYALVLCLSVLHERVCLREFRNRCFYYLPLPLSVLTAYNAAFFSMWEGLQIFSYCVVFLLFLASFPSFLHVWRSGADKFDCTLTFFLIPCLDFIGSRLILLKYEMVLRISTL